MLRILTVLLLLTANPVFAACPSLEKLDDENDDCSSNGKYVEAGISCFVDFETAVKSGAGEAFVKMSSSNKKHVMGDKNSQASAMAGMAADQKISEATLEALIAAGKLAMKNLDGYSRNIYFPEEWDAPQEVIGDGLSYLNSSPCYAEPRDMLKDMGKRAAKYVSELEKTKAALVAMRGITNQRDENIDNIGTARKPASATKGKSAAFRGKKPVNSKSSVTGVEEDAKKRSK